MKTMNLEFSIYIYHNWIIKNILFFEIPLWFFTLQCVNIDNTFDVFSLSIAASFDDTHIKDLCDATKGEMFQKLW